MSDCSNCGAPAPARFEPPRPTQPADLDGRPGEPTRSTLDRWVVTCLRCGATAPDLTVLPPTIGETLKSDAYHAVRQSGTNMAQQRWSVISQQAGHMRDAAEAMLAAAWSMEDAGRNGARLRRQALDLFGQPEDIPQALRLIDIARRAGDFENAKARADSLAGFDLDETAAAILEFEQARIQAQDSSRQQISAAIRPPAARPHVAQTTPAMTAAPPKVKGGGLLGRLFGR